MKVIFSASISNVYDTHLFYKSEHETVDSSAFLADAVHYLRITLEMDLIFLGNPVDHILYQT